MQINTNIYKNQILKVGGANNFNIVISLINIKVQGAINYDR